MRPRRSTRRSWANAPDPGLGLQVRVQRGVLGIRQGRRPFHTRRSEGVMRPLDGSLFVGESGRCGALELDDRLTDPLRELVVPDGPDGSGLLIQPAELVVLQDRVRTVE